MGLESSTFDGADKEERYKGVRFHFHHLRVHEPGPGAVQIEEAALKFRHGRKSPGKTMDRQSTISHQQGKPVPDPATENRS